MADDEQAPKPGHFLPGGEGEQPEPAAKDVPRTALTSPATVNRQQLGLGKARPISALLDPAPKKAAPLPADPAYQDGYSGPPPAALQGAPVTALRGTRQLGKAQPVGWHTTSTRTGVPQFASQPPDPKQSRQLSKPVVSILSVLALIVGAGGVFAGYRYIDSLDSPVANPFTQPSVTPSKTPAPIPADPTVTATVPGVPDAVRLQKNGLYKVGKVPALNCAAPKIKPTNKVKALRFYQAMLPCLNETWEPLVLKAGYPFRQPKLVLVGKASASACGSETTGLSFYCGEDESLNMEWQQDIKNYNAEPVTVVHMMHTMAHEYSHHVQLLTNILASEASRSGRAKNMAEELEWSRRGELQASCLAAVYIGANKKTFGIVGIKLEYWEWMTRHIGDEYNPKKVRDHGSRTNHWRWSGAAFKSADPAVCNTFTASSAKVS